MPRILIADDNPLSLRFFEDALGRAGHDCVCVNDGGDAVAAASEQCFDLLLLDARMPRLDGIAALQHIRASDAGSHASPALATTADTDASRHAELRAAGFVDVLPKPLTVKILQAAVTAHLRIAEPSRNDARTLDDAQALSAAGGDAAIVAALRELLCAELDALPAEIATCVANRDAIALHERLHRLDASAGFCGASGLADAVARLRTALVDSSAWPHAATTEFLAACASLRTEIARPGNV